MGDFIKGWICLNKELLLLGSPHTLHVHRSEIPARGISVKGEFLPELLIRLDKDIPTTSLPLPVLKTDNWNTQQPNDMVTTNTTVNKKSFTGGLVNRCHHTQTDRHTQMEMFKYAMLPFQTVLRVCYLPFQAHTLIAKIPATFLPVIHCLQHSGTLSQNCVCFCYMSEWNRHVQCWLRQTVFSGCSLPSLSTGGEKKTVHTSCDPPDLSDESQWASWYR